MTQPTVCGETLKPGDNITVTVLFSLVEAAVVWAVGEPPNTEGEGGEGQ
jgi:hypothetical protein